MDAFFARNRLSAYLDGELPSGEAREVEAAMLRDPALRAEYDQLRAAVELLRTGGPMAAPEGFAGRLQVRLAAEPPPSRWRAALRRVRPEPAAIAAIAAAALIYVGVRHDPPSPESPPAAPPQVAVATAPGLPHVPDAPASDAPAAPAAADGVLGNEGAYANHAPARRDAPKPTRTAAAGAEREPFEASWEREGADAAAATPDAGAAPEAAAASPPATLYSPAPWRYRVHATGENPLKQLITVASALGGRIVDARGRPLADYPMDEGDAKSVRVFVPSYNVEALQRKLGEIGSVDTIATDADTLYQNGAEVPVAIEVQR